MNKPDKKILAINRNALDLECKNQPQLAFVWGEHLAEAKKLAQQAKNQLKLVEAEIESGIRSNPEKHGLERITDKAVSVLVLQDVDYKYAQKKLLDTEYDVAMLEAFGWALVDRREQLSNLVRLFGLEYFPKPNTDKENRNSTMRKTGEKVKRRVTDPIEREESNIPY